MKNFKILFLITAVLTGLAGITGVLFFDIEGLQSLLLIYTLLLVISLGINVLLADTKVSRLQKVRK